MGRPAAPRKSTEAFVLRTSDYGEADRVVVLLSAEEGRIEGMAHGAHRFRSRFGSALELLSWGRLIYRERPGRQLVTIEGLELIRSAFDQLCEPEGLAIFSHVAELANAVAVPGHEHDHLVRLIHACLDAYREVSDAAAVREDGAPAVPVRVPAPPPLALALVGVYFDLWLAKLEGYWPDLETCGVCGAALSRARYLGLCAQGALCPACARLDSGPRVPLAGASVELARRALREPPRDFVRLQPPAAAVEELSVAATGLLSNHLERELRTQLALPSMPGRSRRP